jgi:peptidoglycan/LPS O-acetylase OafA/YrhL
LRSNASIVEACAIAGAVLFVTLADQSALSLLAPFVFAGVVLVFLSEAGALSHLLKARPLQTLGLLSYSIYMVHLFIGTYATNFGKLLQAKLGRPMLSEVPHGTETIRSLGTTRLEGDLWLLAIVIAVLVCSWLTYRFIEVPARDWFRRLASERAQPKPGVRSTHPVSAAA